MNKILMISPVNPFPPNSGGKVRIFQIFIELLEYFDVRMIIPLGINEKIPKPYIDNVLGVEVGNITNFRKIAAAFSLHPYHWFYWFSKKIKKAIKNELDQNQYSLIYCHFFYTFSYVEGSSLPIIIDAQNVDNIYWQNKTSYFWKQKKYLHSLFAKLNEIKIDYFQKRIIPTTKKIIEVSEQDAIYFQKKYHISGDKVTVIPNGVDLQSYRYSDHSFNIKRNSKIILGFLGSLNLAVNQEAALFLCEDIFPVFQKRHPELDLEILLIGKEPSKSLIDISQMSDGRIKLTGTVETIPPYLNKIDLLVLPLFHGAGTKLRVLEAMASGVVCVGTSFAFNGIEEIRDLENALFAETAEQFIDKMELLFDKSFYQRMAEAAVNVANNYNWVNIGMDLQKKILNLLAEETSK